MARKKKSPARASAPREKLEFPHGASLKGGNPLPSSPREKAAPAPQEKNPYHLNLKAVDDLVTASPENSPPVSKQELRRYHAGPRVHLSDWVKALLLKFWFAGVICYFFIWGLSTYSLNQWDLILILGIALGGVTHLLTKNIYRFMAKTEGAYDRWMMFPRKSLVFLPPDILYALLLIVCTMMTYSGINTLFSGPDGTAVLNVEPLLFGLFVTLWDLLFLGCKHLLSRIVRDARRKVSSSGS